ncbi:hypothetical protein IV417_11760 [Alphaproteobacteria bacterium KMM 3653]|uniref:Cytochrome c domain-containing protein n=1 Tax=Harenicola maris TaxID=2841044 RepID=A0AAP2G911_9RHOB|nr:hypothetical protein [Harenicola maris]
MRILLAAATAMACAAPLWAEGDHGLTIPSLTAEVTPEAGLEAWDRLHEVFTHPRCINCHVGEEAVPLWTTTHGANPGETRPHGMNIHGGDSRVGAEYIDCGTCHVTSTRPNTTPGAPPHAGLDWQLAPLEFQWTGKTPAEICAQVRDPERNGGRDGAGLIEHITHDAEVAGFITWGFTPGAGREPAPGSLQSHLDDTAAWVAAGMPCPGDPLPASAPTEASE